MIMDKEHPILKNRGVLTTFASIDLAPNDQLETGVSAINRDKQVIRMDKLYRDNDIIRFIESLGPLQSTLVVMDMPKNLSLSGRFLQEEVKMHPLRLHRSDGTIIERYEKRAARLYQALEAKGIKVLLYHHFATRLQYKMIIPHKSRSSQGCRALQTALEYQLELKKLPNNLAASSILESLVGAYSAWAVWAGQVNRHYTIEANAEDHFLLTPLALVRNKPRSSRVARLRRGLGIRPVLYNPTTNQDAPKP
jgi:hypothetical protein